jgi:RNA polymerase sigma factor FliA
MENPAHMSPRKQRVEKHEPEPQGRAEQKSPRAKTAKAAKPSASKPAAAKAGAPKAPIPKKASAPAKAAKITAPGKTESKSAAKPEAANATEKLAQKPQVTPLPEHNEPAAAVPRNANGRPRMTLEKVYAPEFEDVSTEEIWDQYRKARKSLPKKTEDLEKLRNVLMERYYPLVRYIAERLLQTLPKSIELDDLVSAGLFGLMDAIRGFDPDRNIKFKTYCTTRIRGSILDQLRSQDWVPRLVRLKAGRIEKALQKLTGEYGREPTHAELASALQMEHTELAMEISSASAKTMFSLSEKWEDRDDDSSIEKVDVLEDRKATDPIGELHRRDMMQFITRSLTHKERFIIEQYYQVGHTMREIGEMLALTESRVCQIHSNVMGRLKGLLGQKSGTLLM